MLRLYHDMAKNIIKKETSKYFIDSGNNLKDFPIEDDNKVERASFMHNSLGKLKTQPNCPNLTTLLLQNNPFDSIYGHFFTRMPNLKILDLSHTNISELPSTICYLKLLQVLQLCHCPKLRSLPSLSKLVKLVVLELFGTPLEQLPSGTGKLKHLKRLNLSHTNLTKFQIGFLRGLESLQELLILMNNAEAYSWRTKESRSAETSVEDLACLDSLRVVHLNFYNNDAFDKYMQAVGSKMPPHFKFCVGGFITYGNLSDNSIAFIDAYPTDNQLLPEETLELHMCRCINSTPNNTLQNSGIAFEKLKILHLSSCSGITYLFSFEMLHNLQNLEKIYARDCSISGIIEPKLNSTIDQQSVFPCYLPKLQELILIDLPKLESICPGQLTLEWPAFRRFSIWKCNELKMLPIIVGKARENLKSIQLKGKNLNLKLEDSSQFEFEETEIPEEIVTFVSLKKPESTQKPKAIKTKTTKRTRTAVTSSENGNVTPPRSPERKIPRRDNAMGLIRSISGHIKENFHRLINHDLQVKEAVKSFSSSSVDRIKPILG